MGGGRGLSAHPLPMLSAHTAARRMHMRRLATTLQDVLGLRRRPMQAGNGGDLTRVSLRPENEPTRGSAAFGSVVLHVSQVPLPSGFAFPWLGGRIDPPQPAPYGWAISAAYQSGLMERIANPLAKAFVGSNPTAAFGEVTSETEGAAAASGPRA